MRAPPLNLAAIAALLLDMDGTLVESDAAVERAWVAWAAEHDVEPEAALRHAHGSPSDVTVRRLRPDLDEAAVTAAAARQLALQYEDLDGVHAAPGLDRLLEALERRRMPWAVVTSADARLAAVRLRAGGIAPPLLVTADDVSRGKPDPEGYLRAAALLEVEPAACLVVEDSEPGLAAGRAAGAATAALKGLDGDLRLDDLAQLAELLLA